MPGQFLIDNPNLIKLVGVRNRETGEAISEAELTVTVCPKASAMEIEDFEILGGGTCKIKATAHGLTTGDAIYIAHCVGARECNGAQTVTVLDADWFTPDGVEPSTDYVQDGIFYTALSGLHALAFTPSGEGVYVATAARSVEFINGQAYVAFFDCATVGAECHVEGVYLAGHRLLNSVLG